MARKATIVEGQTFTDSTGAIVTVVKYESALKVHVQWSDGTVQAKAAAQLRTGNFSQRTRKTKGDTVDSIEQPYKQLQEEAKQDVESLFKPSLFDSVVEEDLPSIDESYFQK